MSVRSSAFSPIVHAFLFPLFVSTLLFSATVFAEQTIPSASTVSIYDIQFTVAPSGDSPAVSQTVTTQGIVYAVYPGGFAMADAEGPWNGIYVYTLNLPTVSVGDEVKVTGTVNEYFGRTTLGLGSNLPTITTLATGQTIHPPSTVAIDMIETGAATAESYEGVFVTTGPITVTNTNPDLPSQFYEWAVTDGNGTIRVNDLAQKYTYTPVLSGSLDFVQGMLHYTFGNTKIEPRDDDDIGFLAGGGLGDCGEPATLIHTIQGAGAASPVVGAEVVVEGVVVGDFEQSTQLNGYYLQEEDGDADSDTATSEGIFVQALTGSGVSSGAVVRIRGTVIESGGLTMLTNLDRFEQCAFSGTVTPVELSLPIPAGSSMEAYEGMLVSMSQTLYVTDNYDLGQYGSILLSANDRLYNPTQIAMPGAAAQIINDANERSHIVLDDGSIVSNPATVPYLGTDNTIRSGDTTDALVGVLDDRFGAYRLHPTTDVSFTRSNPRPSMYPQVGGRVQVASVNMMNYFTTIDTGARVCGPNGDKSCRGADSSAEFNRQRDKLMHAIMIMDVDIVGLVEVENHVTDDALKDIISGLNTRTVAGRWDYLKTGSLGDHAIKVAIIYQPARVTPIGTTAILDNSAESTFDDTLNRPAIAQSFIEASSNYAFTVVVNQFKSKSRAGLTDMTSPDYDQNDGQGFWNATRTAAAEAEARWLTTNPTGINDPDVLILGDLNAYAQEAPITNLVDAGYANQIKRFSGNTEYSYGFQGEFGTLDYALASNSLATQITGAAIWHSNADEPQILNYNAEYNPASLYADNEFRSSDHDALIVGFNPEPRRYFLPIVIRNP